MSLAGVRERLGLLLAHPVTFLLAINIASAVLGLAQFGYALTVLRPADFAVIGVLAAIGGVVAGLLDVKLGDLTTKLYYAAPKEDRRGRGDLLSASLALHLAAGLACALVTFFLAFLIAHRLLEREIAAWWIAAMAARIGMVYPIGAATTFLRLVGDFTGAGWLRLATQTAITVLTITLLIASPDLAGFFLGVAVGAVVSLALVLTVASRRLGRALARPLLAPAPREAFRRHFAASFIAGGSLAGLAKLLSRSCDTLLVAALTNDTVTGLYRVARQGFDSLAGLTDAVHQFYTPTIVDCVTRARWDEYRRHRARLMAIGVAAAAGAVVASWLVLRPLAAARYPQFWPALPAFEVFAGLLVVTLGIHGWLWPTLVASGRVGWFGVLGMAGALTQLAAIALLARVGLLTPAAAAATTWIMAGVTYGPPLIERLRRRVAARSGPRR